MLVQKIYHRDCDFDGKKFDKEKKLICWCKEIDDRDFCDGSWDSGRKKHHDFEKFLCKCIKIDDDRHHCRKFDFDKEKKLICKCVEFDDWEFDWDQCDEFEY